MIAIIIFLMLAGLLLIGVVLIQNPKDGGLSSEFGGGGAQMFGVQKTGDIVEKLTWGFFTFIIVGALVTGIMAKMNGTTDNVESDVNVEKSVSLPSLPATTPVPNSTTATSGTAPAKPNEEGTVKLSTDKTVPTETEPSKK